MTNRSKAKMLNEDNLVELAEDDFFELAEDDFFGLAEGSIKEAELPQKKVLSMKERVMNRIVASEPSGGQTIPKDKRIWHDIAPGISINIIAQDLETKTQTAIWKFQAGAVIPEHHHKQREECLVLKGIVAVGEHILTEGDLHYMDAGTDHEPLRAVTDAELYLKHDIYDDISWLSAH